jgi:serine O-acetyltransferase
LQLDEAEARRLDYAKSIGFQPYAAVPNVPDPVLDAFRVLLDHMQKTDQHLADICKSMKQINPKFCAEIDNSLSQNDQAIIEEIQRECQNNAHNSDAT